MDRRVGSCGGFNCGSAQRGGHLPWQECVIVVNGLCQGKTLEQSGQIAVRIDTIGFRRFNQGIQIGTCVSTIYRIGKHPALATYYNVPFILPISGRKLKSTIAGIRCISAASRLEMLSSAEEV